MKKGKRLLNVKDTVLANRVKLLKTKKKTYMYEVKLEGVG